MQVQSRMSGDESTSSARVHVGKKTDDLSHLKEGDIFVDEETGKKFRVRKTVLPAKLGAGPHNLGDPDDKSLRHVESDILIPNKMNRRLEEVECRKPYLDLVDCFRRDQGNFTTCRPTLDIFNQCKTNHFADPAFRARISEEFIKERNDIRRYGKSPKERELDAFRDWKKKEGDDGK